MNRRRRVSTCRHHAQTRLRWSASATCASRSASAATRSSRRCAASRSTSRATRRSRWSANPARARACPRSRSSACCRRRTRSSIRPARSATAGATCVGAVGTRAARPARRRDLDDLPGADDVAEPGVHRRLPARGSAAPASRPDRQRCAQARDRAARRSRHPGPGVQDQCVPVADVGRPAAARDDRDGDRLRAEAPDRRRADDRARRHDPEADPRPDRRAAEAAPDVGAVHHARSRRRRRDRRPRRRDAPRRDPRAGPGEGDLRVAEGRLHEGAAAVPAAPRPAPVPAAGDRRLHERSRRSEAPRGAPARRVAGRSDHPRGQQPVEELLLARRPVRQARVQGGEERLVQAAEGQDARPRRRVGLGQDDGRPDGSCACTRRRRARCCSRAGTS